MIKEIEGTNLIAVSVPADANHYRVMNDILLNFNGEEPNLIFLPCKCDEFLGEITKDKIEFDVEPYVDKTTWHFPEEHIVYRNYTEPMEDENSVTGEWRQAWNKSFATKEESFYSRLAANGIIDFEKLLIIEKIK